MTTLSTHDTKRGEDVRARLAVLAELPDEWAALVEQLMRIAPVPNRAFGYLLWQTFAGAGLIARERMHAYAEKAMREAADGTGWRDPDAAFEAAVHAAVDTAYELPELAAFIGRITPYGWTNALAQEARAVDDAGRARRLPGHRVVGRLAGRSGQPATGRLGRPTGAAGLARRSPTGRRDGCSQAVDRVAHPAPAPGPSGAVRAAIPRCGRTGRRPTMSSRSTGAARSPSPPGDPSRSNAPVAGVTRRCRCHRAPMRSPGAPIRVTCPWPTCCGRCRCRC